MPIGLKFDPGTHNRSYRTDAIKEDRKKAEKRISSFIFDLPEGFSLEERWMYEFMKYSTHSVYELIANYIPMDGRDGSKKTDFSTKLTNPSKIYSSEIISRVSHPKPSKKQNAKKITKLHEKEFPGLGKTAIHDRSFLNRAFVQYLLGYCTKSQYTGFMNDLESELSRLLDKGYNMKPFFLNVSKETQNIRLEERRNDYFKNFRYSESDKKALGIYERLSEQVIKASEIYEKAGIPLIMINTENEEGGFIELIKSMLVNEKYEKKSEILDFSPSKKIVGVTLKEIKNVLETKKNN